MSFKDLFNPKAERTEEENISDNSPGNITPEFTQGVIKEMLELQKQNKLSYSLEEYLNNEEFLVLLQEFEVKAAVRIFDAEEKAKAALETGKSQAIEDLKKRRSIPKPIRSSQPATAEPDFSRMSSEEFSKYKKQLQKTSKR